MDAVELLRKVPVRASVVMLDPWYNKGVGGVRDDYYAWLQELLLAAGPVADHVFLWGYPEIVYKALDFPPEGFHLNAWLTWYYKNCPSVIRGWRSAQMTCLHFSRKGAAMFPERFLNEAQLAKQREGKLRYMPGPPSVIETDASDVIEAALPIGFVARKEQTGHPAQKPRAAIEPLLRMTMPRGGLVIDPMCGSGTTGAVAIEQGYSALLNDWDPEHVARVEARLRVTRRPLASLIAEFPPTPARAD